MDPVPENISFPKTEEAILQLWKDLNAFETSVKKSEGRPEYTFYDGPPFATGLPHYGHILAGTIKDTVTRYAHQTGHHVIRRFGWDCHGLPIEFEIDKELGIKTREEVLKLGIPKYNAACRSIVMRYSSEWEKIVTRLGRWIDFKNDYKTMDIKFMESVWWVFKQISEKDLVYRGFKVMPYSTACATPLSNFEANLAYKEVQDPAVMVAFPLVENPKVSLVAWTTTPWTLPSNLALCVNPELMYAHVFDKEHKKEYILAEERLTELYKAPDQYEVKDRFKGATLKGKRYQPLFAYFERESDKGAFQVLVDNFVTNDSGTGVVHCAPAFGEDDYRVCLSAGIIAKGESLVCPVDDNGHFTKDVTDFVGKHVKDADKDIIKTLKNNGRLVHQGVIAHSYPFCWRSDTPLIYKAVPSWFIAVEKVRDRLLVNNKKSYWVPDYVQEKRFHNWLADAKDWAVSRNRFWGTPIPIWISDDGEEKEFIGSIDELEKWTGVRVTDLHKESIDHLTFTKNGKLLKRVEEVFDCWFESGSMPYAQIHYPFENEKLFKEGFPADFIAEGIDQTRGWFYTLLVISTILEDKPPFKNLIVNGLVLAADGKKMSKRLKNYPDPMNVINEYGSDALRLYLINSPVVRAETLKFQEKGVRDIIKEVFLPWFNAYRFFTETVRKYNGQSKQQFAPSTALALKSTNVMDKWIMAATTSLIKFVRGEMEAYRLYTVVPRLVKFIEQLTNWYVRLNRRRLKGVNGPEDTLIALSVLCEVILTITKAMAPFTPFLTEYFYQNLKKIIDPKEREDSVHYLMFPTAVEEALNTRIEESVARMQSVIQLGRQARDRKTLPIKFPLTGITVIHKDPQFHEDIQQLKPYILEELNIKEVTVTADESAVVTSAKPDSQTLGKRLRKDLGKVSARLKALSHAEIQRFKEEGKMEIEGHIITSDEVQITREFKGDTTRFEAAWDNDILIILDLQVDENMRQQGLAREVVNRIQRLRKKAGIHPTDPIEVFYETDAALSTVINAQRGFIQQTTAAPMSPLSKKPRYSVEIMSEEAEVLGTKLKVVLCVLAFAFSTKNLRPKCPDDSFFTDLQTAVAIRDYALLLQSMDRSGGKFKLTLNDKTVELELGKDIFRSFEERALSGNDE